MNVGTIFFRGAWLCALLCLGMGCVNVRVSEDPGNLIQIRSSEESRHASLERGTTKDGIEVIRASSATSSEGTVLAFGFDQELYRFTLVATTTRLSIRTWKELFPAAVAGVNGVYFHPDLLPSGWFISPQFTQRVRKFDAESSALILIEDRLRLVNTSREQIDIARVQHGAQTYPVLIHEGRPQLTRDTGKQARRSWIGVDRNGRVWLGVVSDGQVSLYRLMERLMELGIDWGTVLNLDGGPSTGMFLRGEEEVTRETIGGVPNMLLVERR